MRAVTRIDSLHPDLVLAAQSDDARLCSYAIGGQALLAAEMEEWERAARLARQAQYAAQQVLATDALYRWEAVEGRAMAALGDRDRAIVLYQRSLDHLEQIRAELIAADAEQRIDFRESVEPYYRELASLLVAAGRNREAIAVSQRLQLAELQNFFGDDCAQIAAEVLAQRQATERTAILHVLTLPEQVVAILDTGGGLTATVLPVAPEEFAETVEGWRFDLENALNTRYLAGSEQLYGWLIAPFEEELAAAQPDTLAIATDGILRDVPLAALRSPEGRFLVEDFAIATSIGGLGLGRPVRGEALVLGLSEATDEFPPLPQVVPETQFVFELLGGQRLLDSEFRAEVFKREVAAGSFDVLHVATHARFRGTAKESFILASNGRIGLREFERVLREREDELALLVLSACGTAAGNGRAALGFAGIAARTATSTVVGSLWVIEDVLSAALVTQFYESWLVEEESPARAMKSAQVELIRQGLHPSQWAPFLVVIR